MVGYITHVFQCPTHHHQIPDSLGRCHWASQELSSQDGNVLKSRNRYPARGVEAQSLDWNQAAQA